MILYKTVMEEAEAEQTIEKSRFISHIKPGNEVKKRQRNLLRK